MSHGQDEDTGEGQHDNIWDIMHFHEQQIHYSHKFMLVLLILIFLTFILIIVSAYLMGVFQELELKRYNQLNDREKRNICGVKDCEYINVSGRICELPGKSKTISHCNLTKITETGNVNCADVPKKKPVFFVEPIKSGKFSSTLV